MTIQVRFFAGAKELARTDSVRLELEDGADVGRLRRAIAERFPVLQPLLDRSAIAVDDDLAEDATVLRSGCQVAVLPPVSGGAT